MGNCAERPNAWEPKPTSSCMRESLYFKQSASIDIYIKDEQGRVIDTEEIRLRLTRPQESKHRIINGIGWSYAIFPGQDPRQFHIKECQDSCLLAENQGKFLFGVFDGHGKSGRDVSLFCVKKSTELFRDRVDSFENDEEAQLKKLVEDVAQAAETSSMVPNILISGTTAVLVYFDGKKIFVANVGDSMAVLGYYDDNRPQRQDIMTQITYMGDRILTAKPLTEMHKPSVPEEKKRVEEYGGDIRKLKDGFGEDMGPLRVFKQGSEQPGICMTRSIGDLIATEVGVISEPTITQFDYNPDIDEMLIIGSDGLWDALEGHDAVNFVQKYRDRWIKNHTYDTEEYNFARRQKSNISQFLGEYARKNWMKLVVNEDIWIDDIGLVVIEFKCEDSDLPLGDLRSKSTPNGLPFNANQRSESTPHFNK